MEEYLKQNGWILNHRCTCGGPLKEFYRSDKYKAVEVIITPKQGAFELRLKNTRIASGKDVESLINKLTENNYVAIKTKPEEDISE